MALTTVENYIFDVDGTIADTAPAILRTIRKSLILAGMEFDEKNLTKNLIGPPLPQIIAKLLPWAKSEEIEKVVSVFRSQDSELISGVSLYTGIKDLLEFLKNNEKRCFIATNKPQKQTLCLLNALNINSYFEAVYTPDIEKGFKINKTEMLKQIIKRFNLLEQETIMIGDTLGDIQAAKEVGCLSLVALWGYGKDKESVKTAATYYAYDAEEIKTITEKK